MPAQPVNETSTPSDAQLLDCFVTAVDDALEAVQQQPELTPSEQLSTLVVGVVRGVMPTLRAERDRMLAEERADQEPEEQR